MRKAGSCSWQQSKAAAGHGGTAAVHRAAGVARSTIIRGAQDLWAASSTPARVRRKGAGRPLSRQADLTVLADPTVLDALRRLVEPAAIGDPMRPLLWVSKSREKLAVALRAMNHPVSANAVARMLVSLGYSRPVNRKTKEGSRYADRNGQFQHITQAWRGKPLVSRLAGVDLIAATKTGLAVRCELDENSYPKAMRVADLEMAALNIATDPWHPEWNYTISPRLAERRDNC